MINQQSFMIDGKLAYQAETHHMDGSILVKRCVQQKNGEWWKYVFYKGKNIGTPVRSKKDQKFIIQLAETIKSEIGI